MQSRRTGKRCAAQSVPLCGGSEWLLFFVHKILDADGITVF